MKITEITMSIRVCLISGMNIDYTKNSGRNAVLANPKHQFLVSQCGKHDCHANKKKNGDYYKYPSLSQVTDELCLKEKWWKESFSSKSKALISCILMWQTRFSCQ